MRLFYPGLALCIIAMGFVCLWKTKDLDTFRFCVISGMLFNIYAKVEDL